MKTETIVMCVVALLLGMLLANMLKSVCGCKTVVEGNYWTNVRCMTQSPYVADSDDWRSDNLNCNRRYDGPGQINDTDTYNHAEDQCSGGVWSSTCKLVSTPYGN
jgi:hypothetical protein